MAQFKTRARALDLLGRQQIAGIPTAINELIKNAYDAYADHFDISYLRSKELLVLRDDGIGMSLSDFENRWLTLGTESKSGSTRTELPIDPDKKPRPVTGEKGIGRLAIASIGSQVLILTCPKNGESKQIVGCFINWEMFEIPGINLEDLSIPIKEYRSMPGSEEILSLTEQAIGTIQLLYNQGKVRKDIFERISYTIKSFKVDPLEIDERIGGSFHLSNSQSGTHFYISPVAETFNSDIEKSRDSDEATKMEKTLLGFHNSMIANENTPQIDISFRDYRSDDGSYVSIIDKDHFFTAEDFDLADHHFVGSFDKYGQFRGTIQIYGEHTFDQIIPWSENYYRETDCGPFKINIAYLQGESKSSKLGIEEYARLKAKSDRLGGLYIYRNNIRVLPYGDADYDFLDIEKNRTKKMSRYFFSFRRIIGAVEISDIDKSKLIEKAGREGFIENRAYRQFQSILKNFFWQVAQEYFNEERPTAHTDFYSRKKEELNALAKALERQDQLSRRKRDRFVIQIESFFKKLNSNRVQEEVDGIIKDLDSSLSTVVHYKDMDAAGQAIIDYEFATRRQLSEYKKNLAVPAPKGFALKKSLKEDYFTYLDEYKILTETVFKDADDSIDSLVAQYTKKLNIEVNKRKRLEEAVELISQEAQSTNKKKRAETFEAVSRVTSSVKDLANELLSDLDNQILSVKSRFQELATQESDTFDLVQERNAMENQIDAISQRNTDIMDSIIRQFESFYISKEDKGNIVTSDQVHDAMAEELDELRGQLSIDVELSQLGLAVGVIHHEFNSTITSIRHSLRDLKAWSDVDQNLEGVYKNIKVNFEHLDSYLTLFTPLNRRLYREREEIPLRDINQFLLDLFKNRLMRHNIQLKHTKGFSARTIYGFRSTFYPVFVNIVDNAIYWLSSIEDNGNRIIRLHADDSGIYISNNGPQIRVEDKERIFDLRFSRKPLGRGLGLTISREVLEDEKYELFVDSPRNDSTVTFKIQKKED